MSESSFYQIQTTTASKDEAEVIARALLDASVAACVKIVPGIESHYRWEGKIECASEFLLLISTTKNKFADVERIIKKLHSYDLPEIISLKIKYGSSEYLQWLEEGTR